MGDETGRGWKLAHNRAFSGQFTKIYIKLIQNKILNSKYYFYSNRVSYEPSYEQTTWTRALFERAALRPSQASDQGRNPFGQVDT